MKKQLFVFLLIISAVAVKAQSSSQYGLKGMGQNLLVKDTIDGKAINSTELIMPEIFLHFEHTDGANWLHINYVRQLPLFKTKTSGRSLLTAVGKIGGGINIPKTDFTWRYDIGF